MKKLNYTFSVQILLIVSFIPFVNADANWIKEENNSTQTTQTTQTNQDSKDDSLPEGVTKGWLNNLRDENGNKITGNNSNTSRVPEDPEEQGDAMSERFLTGYTAGDQFGYSVSSAGDVNGDGYSDVVVGAFGNDAGGSDAGRAYIYFGGITMDNTADVILTGEASTDRFGRSVSSAGDVNGDGYSDVVVGAYRNDAGGPNAGRAYIYFGGNIMDNTPDVILTGEATFDEFGTSVSSAGDVNGDGYSDIIVGAYGNDAGGNNAGRAYIYFGGITMDNTVDVILTGETVNDQFGNSVSLAGDVNGDGYSDIVVGANGNDAGGSDAGRAYIFFGGNIMDNSVDVILTGEAAVDLFGYSVSSAGDVNGDGYSDVIIGSYFNDAGGSDAGRAYIYFGGIAMDNTADVIFTGEDTFDNFGYSVSSAGDLNGDGYSDVVVGAFLNDGGGSDAGRAYIFFGGIAMDNTADVIFTGEDTFDNFGYSVSSAGDVNRDGYSDIIVGALYNDAGGTDAGRVYIYKNSMTGTDIADEIFTGEAAGDEFGVSVSSAGDVNGDGYSDILIGAWINDNGGSNAGRAYIFYGGNALNNTAVVVLTGEAAEDRFGYSVSSAGDVNGDGYSDVVIGAFLNDAGGSGAGAAYIYFGGNVMDNISDIILTGEAAGDNFGVSVSSAGDVNDDGFNDVIVGAYANDAGGTDAGSAYIYFGGNAMDNTADVILTGEAVADHFGGSVSSAGDVNDDGNSDVIVGALGNDAGGGNAGRAYIYFGGNVMDSTVDVTLTGEAVFDTFGNSVSSSGDVNGDGFSDVIIGAKFNDAGGNNSGRAFIYFGGSSMDNTADVLLTGETANDLFGYSVYTAGDINDDGFSDVVVGAYLNDSGGSDAGKAYVFFGGNVMDTTADVILTGEEDNDYFGYSVSSAGDVNGDGNSDIVVGAYKNDAGGSDAGSSYLYLSSSPSVKPVLNFVKDVPNDQGGFVNLKWARSGFDVSGNNIVTGYSVFRSDPPSKGIFFWEEIVSVTPAQQSFYTYTATTPNDTASNSSGNFFYKIRATTSDPGSYWESAIQSGKSIDNIAPPIISSFTAAASGIDILLNWERSTAPDLMNYVLFRSSDSIIDPYTDSILAITTDSVLLDSSPFSGSNFYFIVAQDIHNNYSPVAVTQIEPGLVLDLTMFIEGFYSQGINLQVSDTVIVELRDQVSPFAVVDQKIVVVESDGTVQLSFGNTPDNDYYISIKHRNSIETWSSSPITLTKGVSNSYDLSISSSQAFGNNMPQVDASPVRFAIYSGDENQNGTVDLTDVVNVSNDASTFTTGYVPTDMNGDGVVDLSDLVITSNNASKFVAKIVP